MIVIYHYILIYLYICRIFSENERLELMGIVKISDNLHEAAKLMAKAMSRSINSQAEHWIKIGKLVEENPLLTYHEVLKLLIKQAELTVEHREEVFINRLDE